MFQDINKKFQEFDLIDNRVISVVPHFTSKRINTQIMKDSFEHEIYDR